MDLPQPPQEQELKNIIDKLAQFVARNGLEFEQMTKTKQKDNPKFSFLFGGEFFNYYQYKVTTEQAILKHRQTKEPPPQNHGQHMPNQIMQGPPPQQNNMPPFQGSNNHNYGNQFPYNYGPGPGFGGEHNHYPPPMGNNYPPPHGGPPFNMPPVPGEGMLQSGPPPMPGPNYNSPLPGSTFPPGEQPFQHPPGGFPPRGPNPESPFNMQPPPMINAEPNNRPNYPQNIPQSDSPGLGKNIPIPNNNRVPLGAPPGPTNDSSGTSPMPSELSKSLESAIQEQRGLKEQIKQSEANLSAQQLVLDQQKETQVNEALFVALGETLRKNGLGLGLNIQEFDDLLNPITESCTKDSIANGKQWIFTHATSHKTHEWVASYLLYKTTCTSGVFTHKLHIIYLMNDVLHHCLRKNADALKEALEKVLPPMYCNAVTCATEDQKLKLDKLLLLWENKMHLEPHLIGQLKSPEETSESYMQGLRTQFPQVLSTVTTHLEATFEGYRQQHNAFVQHATTQIQQLDQRITQLEQQQQAIQREQQQQAPAPPPSSAPFIPFANSGGTHQFPGGPPIQSSQPVDFNQPPPGFNMQPGSLPPIDFSKPPPGFVQEEKENLVPTVPYFELPAALMAPLIHISEKKFKPLDPAKLRLPMPTPPTERLLAAVDSFYQPPSHERPRNCDGWEQLALFDYYKAKTYGIKEKERLIEEGHWEVSRSPSPVTIEQVDDDDINVSQKPTRRYRSVSPDDDSLPTSNAGSRTPSQSRSPTRINRRSITPPSHNRRLSPAYNSPRRRSRSRSRSATPPSSMFGRKSRSVTPPSFGVTQSGSMLDENNKGHQMLRSMGWSGLGLGANEQGIAVPIASGEVRDSPSEKFRGLGASSSNNDPFEAFRKNKGQAFINRIKQRAEERSNT